MPTIEFSNELFNPVYYPVFDTEFRYNLIYGGAGGGKSEFLIQRDIIRRYERDNFRTMWVRKNYEHIRESSYQTFKDIVDRWGLSADFKFYKSPLLIEASNGFRVIFKGANDPETLKSLAEVEEIKMEEANQFVFEDFNQIDLRLRGESTGKKKIFLLFNPVDENHWLKKQLIDIQKEDIFVLRTTYLDNKFVGKDYVKSMNRLKDIDPLYYQVYALGEWGVIKPKRPFFDKFDKQKHVSSEAVHNTRDPYLFLSFDFNIINSCIVLQNDYDTIQVLKEYHEEGWDLERLCYEIKTDFPLSFFKINGDPSGNSRSATTKGNESAYALIRSYLNLSWEDFNCAGAHPSHLNSRLLSNVILKSENVLIHPFCKALIEDLEKAEVDERGSLDPWKKKNPLLGHLCDCLRYHFHYEHYDKLSKYGLDNFSS